MSKRSHLFVGGTGAVAGVYGLALHKAGDRVGMFLRPRNVNDLHTNENDNTKRDLHIYNLSSIFHTKIAITVIITGIAAVCLTMFLQDILPLWFIITITILMFIITFFSPMKFLTAKYDKLTISQNDVFTSTEAIESSDVQWDYLWLCLSPMHLRQNDGKWLDKLIESIKLKSNQNSTIVLMSPGPNDVEYIISFFPCPERIISGTIGTIVYQCPMKNEKYHPTLLSVPGLAVFYPPGEVSRFYCKGGEVYSTYISQTLTKGGCPSAFSQTNPAAEIAVPGPVLQVLVLSLESVGWKFSSLINMKNKNDKKMIIEAVKEAVRVSCLMSGKSVPFLFNFIWGEFLLHIILRLAPLIMPFDFETYMHYHFSKGPMLNQTMFLLNDYVKFGADSNGDYECTQLVELITKVENMRRRREGEEKEVDYGSCNSDKNEEQKIRLRHSSSR